MKAFKRLQMLGANERHVEPYTLYGEIWSDVRNNADGVFLAFSPI